MNVLKAQQINDLQVLLKAGLSYRAIGRQLGIWRETVSKYDQSLGISGSSKAASGEGGGRRG